MDHLCPACGLMHREDASCLHSNPVPTPTSPVIHRRRPLKSPSVTPGSSGRSTPTSVRVSGDFGAYGGPTPGKQKRLSGILNMDDLVIKDEPVDVEEISSDFEEVEADDAPAGASQYANPDDLDPEAGGLLLGFAYLPSEVTLPNLVPVRPGLQEVDLTPGEHISCLFYHTYILVFLHVIFTARRTSVAAHAVMYKGKMFTFQVPPI